MRYIKKKRLVYRKVGGAEILYGGVEFDGRLTDENILGMVHEKGKTEWLPSTWHDGMDLYLMKFYPNSKVRYPAYCIEVDEFYETQKSWYNKIWDWIRR